MYTEHSECFRAPDSNLVYVRNEKCASTYYAGLFRANHWQKIPFNSIDWNTDSVFSFIRDPLIRHIKGLVEDMILLGCECDLAGKVGKNFWAELPWLGLHSVPTSIKFGEYASKINWIPIDALDVTSEDLVKQLLFSHNIEITWYDNLYKRESDSYHVEIYNKILIPSMFKRVNFQSMCTDYDIYYGALERYNISRDRILHQLYLI